MPGFDKSGVSWTAAELLTDVRQKARIPAGTLSYTDAILLEEASRQVWSFAGWAMSTASGGRQISVLPRSTAAALNSPYAPGREVFLPFDAVGDAFDSIFWVDSAGGETRLEVMDLYAQPLYDAPGAQGRPWGFSVLDGRVRLYPKPVGTGTVRINYQRRLPKLVPATSGAAVTGGTISAADVQVVTGAALVPPLIVGDYLDVISANYPHRYVLPLAPITSIVASVTYVTTAFNSTTFNMPLTTGMTVFPAGVSSYVHLPLEFKSCLTLKIAAQVLGEIGDAEGGGMLEQKAEMEIGRVLSMLIPRSQTARVKVVNPYSLMRARRGGAS